MQEVKITASTYITIILKNVMAKPIITSPSLS